MCVPPGLGPGPLPSTLTASTSSACAQGTLGEWWPQRIWQRGPHPETAVEVTPMAVGPSPRLQGTVLPRPAPTLHLDGWGGWVSWAGQGSLAVDSFLPPTACSLRSRMEGDSAWGLLWRGQPLSGPATARAPHEPTAPLPSRPLSRQGDPSRGQTPAPGWSPTPRGPGA